MEASVSRRGAEHTYRKGPKRHDVPASELGLFDPVRGTRAPARATDPDTSHEAAEGFSIERLTAIQRDVFEWFRSVGRGTDEDLELALGEKYPAFSTLRKRRTDIFQRHLIRDSGERRLNRNGRRMIVWEVADEPRQEGVA